MYAYIKPAVPGIAVKVIVLIDRLLSLLGHLYVYEIGLTGTGFTTSTPAMLGTVVDEIVLIDHLLTLLGHFYV